MAMQWYTSISMNALSMLTIPRSLMINSRKPPRTAAGSSVLRMAGILRRSRLATRMAMAMMPSCRMGFHSPGFAAE
ncbi:MAG: hypothetical protein IJJ14_07345 [Coriobacteriales bacterium]|nr:hypothetical protein [Coriobacteriales bacterium]MBQ6585711.1 hypothetical protein [Coriobacteriales bacterium]